MKLRILPRLALALLLLAGCERAARPVPPPARPSPSSAAAMPVAPSAPLAPARTVAQKADEMDDFAAVPGMPNLLGMVQSEANAVAPGKRMLSAMSPTIVTSKEGQVELVLGAAGGPTILTTVFQILSNVVDFGFDITAAVNAPRFHQQDFPDKRIFEEGDFPIT